MDPSRGLLTQSAERKRFPRTVRITEGPPLDDHWVIISGSLLVLSYHGVMADMNSQSDSWTVRHTAQLVNRHDSLALDR